MAYTQSKEEFVTMNLDEMRKKGFLEGILERQKTNKGYVDLGEGWKNRDYCPICESKNKTYQFTKFEMDLYKCDECNTGFFEKVPVNTNDIYSAPKALNFYKEGYLNNKDYRMIRFAKERVDLINKYVNKKFEDLSILDVGCGTGWFLEAAKLEGAECFGLELGKDLAKFTSNRLDIKVWDCDLLELEVEQKFDVITMFDLIEHIEKPVELISKAKEFLEKDGFILIFTPQFDSVAIQTLKEYSNLVMPAEHLSYFTYETMLKLAELTDMEMSYYQTKGIDLGDLKGYADYVGDYDKSQFYQENYDLLQPTIDASNSGNHLRAILKTKL